MKEHKNAPFHKENLSYLEVLAELQEAHLMQDSKAALDKIRALRLRSRPNLNPGFERSDE